jgi:death-on-curing protein
MEIIFLTLDDVMEIHADQVAAHGGEPSVRDLGLLASAVEMPAASFGGQYLHEFPHEMAAAYLFHLCANHPFVDGNKRTSLDAALTFLRLNGYEIDATPQNVIDFTLAVASGKLGKAEAGVFFKRHVRRA